MCGIVGYIGEKHATDILLDGLSRLEYRGYDSAGIALVSDGKLVIRRAQGKLAQLRERLRSEALGGTIGIGHTRWATHGKPSENNAHPHRYGAVTVVHNGIIENFSELRETLIQQGHTFSSETDTEIIAHLVQEEQEKADSAMPVFTAFRRALHRLRGSFAIALLHESEPEHLYVARNGSPLVVGIGAGEKYVASDVPALLPYTKEVLFLHDGEMAMLSRQDMLLEDLMGKAVERPSKTISWTLAMAEKGGYKHFMLKEIFEQPQALAETLRGHVDMVKSSLSGSMVNPLLPTSSDKIEKIYLIACGTSWHAALTAKYFLERELQILVMVEQASEFRYRNPLLDRHTLVVAVSQSGETADTLVALRNAKENGAKVLSVTNVVDSSIARESDAVLYTHAGPEIGVAATKTFTAQLVAMRIISLLLHQKTPTWRRDVAELWNELMEVPAQLERVLRQAEKIREIALKFSHHQDCLFIGRGPQFPIALEGALKLKEISYIHAEGYPAGELKHGPIALLEKGSPVVAIALADEYHEKMLSNIQEVLSRQASVIAIASEGDEKIRKLAEEVIELPKLNPSLMPILTAVPLQLLAYFIADHRGHDVDQPRNLAKSVTVE